MRIAILTIFVAALGSAEIYNHPGGKEGLPHQKYIRVVSEKDSPIEQLYLKTKDGLYVAAALRKPKGDGPFPAILMFHGAPGGRGMEQLVGWSRGDHGGPVWERFLQEGYVVVVGDYRGGARSFRPPDPADITYVDDGLTILEYVRSLPYVDSRRISLYGVSLGGNLVLQMISRTTVNAAVLGAPAAMMFLGVTMPPAAPGANPADRFKNMVIDKELAARNIAPIQTPVLILVGTADSLLPVDRRLHEMLAQAGKRVRMDIYENGYHDFVLGPQGQKRKDTTEPLLDSTLDALEKTVLFVRGDLK